jgi:outer membrane receptor for ferrienterochelin and colicins
MYTRIITIIIFGLVSGGTLWASNVPVKGVVKEKNNATELLVGANVHFAGTTIGTTTDAQGRFELNNTGHYHELVVSFVGYVTDTLHIPHSGEKMIIELAKDIELNEVTVNERRKGVYHSKIDPMQTQKLTSHELQKAACCNLSESFETNASVDVAYSDAVTGAKQIQMLGLSGIYVQTITENMPSIRGMASPYGLGYIPGPWMESIQISKGTSSVINGYEAIAGQINVEYKKPDTEERFHFNLFGSDEARFEANLNASFKVKEDLSTMVLLHAENQTMSMDDNGDGFMDLPLIQQINFINRWEQHGHDGAHRQIGVKIIEENRRAGQVGAFDNTDPNLYGIEIGTSRYEVFAKNGIIFDKPGTSLGIQLSGSYHNQGSTYGRTNYGGTQYNGYLNVIYQSTFGESDLHGYSTGVSFLADRYNETLLSKTSQFDEMTPGAFFQYTYNLHNHLSILAGVRTDYSTQHGFFATPRLHVKANVTDWLVARGSIGKGYRTPMPMPENTQFLASSRQIIIDSDLNQEEALNMGANLSAFIPVGPREFMIAVDFYRTSFQNQVVRDVDSNPHAVHFYNLNGESYSNAFQAELNYEPIRGLTVNAAYRVNDVKQTIGGVLREAPLTNRSKGLISLSYVTPLKKWQFDYTSQFNGGGRMPDPDTQNPLWNASYDPFTVMIAQVTKNFKRWSFYVGSENLTSFTQENPIISANDPWSSTFDGSMIWGPVHGRKIYAGLRYTFNKYE